MKMFKWYTWVISELFYGYIDINCLNKFEVENECKLDTSNVSSLWQLEGANASAVIWNAEAGTVGRERVGFAVVVQWSKLAF